VGVENCGMGWRGGGSSSGVGVRGMGGVESRGEVGEGGRGGGQCPGDIRYTNFQTTVSVFMTVLSERGMSHFMPRTIHF
jgi:hypothetical protein